MIDFRYHLVSIIAVFLALALGIVVGTTALNGGIVDTLRSSQNKIISDKRGLEAQVKDLRGQVGRRDQFTDAVTQRVVGGRLDDQRVLFVAGPDASADTLRQLEQVVRTAGGTPTGVLRLRDDLVDPDKGTVVDDVVAKVAPAGVELPDGSAAERAVVELAAALVARSTATALPEDAAAKVLGGFTGGDLVQLQAPDGGKLTTAPATMAVVVTGGANGKDLDGRAKTRQQVLLSLARALDDRSSGVVVGGPRAAAETGGVIAAVRDDRSLDDAVSSVDVADASYGRVVVVLALNEQQSGGAGSYGEGPGAESAAPPPGQ